jgi:hypothetical protein
LHAYLTPLNFSSCNTFIFKPAQPCINPPRSNTRLRAYATGKGERCAWNRIDGQVASECQCEAKAALDPSGTCSCELGFFGDGKRFCYPTEAPVWREFYSEVLTGQKGPPPRYGHGWVTVGDSMWLFGGFEEVLLNSTEEMKTDDNATNAQSSSPVVAVGALKNNITNNTNNTHGEPKYRVNVLGDLHSFSARSYMWTSYGDAVELGGPPKRAHHAMVSWDQFVFVHGGVGENDVVLGDFYMLDTYTDEEITEPLWTDLNTLNNAPSPRLHHAMAAVTRVDGSGVLFMYGGVSKLNGSAITELYDFDIASKSWRHLLYSKGPRARFYHT